MKNIKRNTIFNNTFLNTAMPAESYSHNYGFTESIMLNYYLDFRGCVIAYKELLRVPNLVLVVG